MHREEPTRVSWTASGQASTSTSAAMTGLRPRRSIDGAGGRSPPPLPVGRRNSRDESVQSINGAADWPSRRPGPSAPTASASTSAVGCPQVTPCRNEWPAAVPAPLWFDRPRFGVRCDRHSMSRPGSERVSCLYETPADHFERGHPATVTLQSSAATPQALDHSSPAP